MTTFSKTIDEKQIVFLTASRLIDFFKDDKHLLHAIRFEEGIDLLQKLEKALPSFLYTGRQDELYYILTNLIKITVGLENYDRLNSQVENIIKLFTEKESLYMDIGQRDHWLHVILVNLFCHLLAELDVNNFPPGQGEKGTIGGHYPKGEIIGINLPHPKGFVDNNEYNPKYIPDLKTEESIEPTTGKKLLLLNVFNRYFLDWALTLASLFHDCSYPLSPKILTKFHEKIEDVIEEYNKTFKAILQCDFVKSTNISIKPDSFNEYEFKNFTKLLQGFYFCNDPEYDITANDIKERMEKFEHDVLSAYFVYLIKENLLSSEIKEEKNFKENIDMNNIEKGHLVKDLKNFYLDAAIHAIAFHHTSLEIKWEWNPILYLLRISDVACSFARPEIEVLRGRTVKLEGINFGVDGEESLSPRDKGLIKIFIGYDYRNKSLATKEDEEAEERHILEKKIWKNNLENQIPNLEKLDWLEIGTQLLGKFNIEFESP